MSVLATSARGASFLIIFQVLSRGTTFLVNQILLRFLSPELLGVSAQLDLYARTVISFAKDSIEVAAQREAHHAQAVVNLAYLALAAGVPLAAGLAALYLKADVPDVPYFAPALWVYAVSCVIELAAEPAFVAAQQRLLFKVRASADATATIARCVATCIIAILAFKWGFQPGALPFAGGQLAFGTMTLAVYVWRMWSVAAEGKFSLLPQKIAGDQFYLGFLSKRLCQLCASLFVQNVFKYILTQGDSILITALASLSDQGAYALATNYGGLIARMLFQPIEETSRNIFAQLCTTRDAALITKTEESGAGEQSRKMDIRSARALMQSVLHFYLLIGLVAVTLGPSLAPLLLRLVAGSSWSSTQASSVLATYCYYIPLLAINGITEAFVAAVADVRTLHVQSALMVVWFGAFGVAAWRFVKVSGYGARGLVLANCVNMALRIIYNTSFAWHYFNSRGERLDLVEIVPSPMSVATAVGVWAALRADLVVDIAGRGLLQELATLGVITVAFGFSLLYFERAFILQWVQPIIDKYSKRQKAE